MGREVGIFLKDSFEVDERSRKKENLLIDGALFPNSHSTTYRLGSS